MAAPTPWLYTTLFLGALGASLMLTPLVRRFAHRFELRDAPGGGKFHLEPVALLGGLGIYGGAFLAGWIFFHGPREELKGLFLSGLVVSVFGLHDDLNPMDPALKFVAQGTAALVLVGFDVQVHLTHVALIDVALSVAWPVLVMNAINYQDNINGLCAGLAAVCALGFFAIAVTSGQYVVASLSLLVAGGSIGFLPSNFPKARIFMGDSGSMFLGLVLAFLGIRLRFLDRALTSTFLLPALVLAVPLFDTGLVTISRIRRGVSPLAGGTDHTSHRLNRLGLSATSSVVVLWSAQAVACIGALGVATLGGGAAWAIYGAAAVAGLVALYVLELRRAAPRAGSSRSRPPGDT